MYVYVYVFNKTIGRGLDNIDLLLYSIHFIGAKRYAANGLYASHHDNIQFVIFAIFNGIYNLY